jgi:hypothetical protein
VRRVIIVAPPPPPNVGSGLGWLVVAMGLVIPWALLVIVDRRLRRPR